MTSIARSVVLGLALAALGGCASTQVSSRQVYEGERLARPDRILVMAFAATAADLPSWTDVASRYEVVAPASSPEELAAARQLGAKIAEALVEDIREMGLNAVRYEAAAPPRDGDLVILGYFESVDPGSAAKRIALGFGSGDANLRTRVEGYHMTAHGLRLLGAGTTDAGGGKGPGVAVPLAVALATSNPIGLIVSGAVKAEGEATGRTTLEGSADRTAKEIATQLQAAFERQGWI